MKDLISIYDLDLNSHAGAIGYKFAESKEWPLIDAADFAAWRYAQGVVENWYTGTWPTGQAAAFVKHSGKACAYVEYDMEYAAQPVQDWLRCMGKYADEHVVRYLDSKGNWEAALLLNRSQQSPERAPEEPGPDQRECWMISMYQDIINL